MDTPGASSPAPQAAPSPAPARRAPGRPTQEAAAGLKDLYLQAALDTFLEKGFARASVDEIARRAGAGKMTFYRQFGSKEELFKRITHHAIAKVRHRLQSELHTDGPPEQVLRELIERLHIGLTDPEYLAVWRMVVGESQRFPELREVMINDDRFLLEPVSNYLHQAAAQGLLDIADPGAATMQLTALASGGGRFLLKTPNTDPGHRARWVQAILDFVLAAWLPRSQTWPAADQPETAGR